MTTALIWFRQDLRLHDHRALSHAVKAGHNILCCYVLEQSTKEMPRMGGASQWWLNHALKDLTQQLKKIGGKLILRQGSYEQVLLELVDQSKADALYFSRNYEPYMHKVEQRLRDTLTMRSVEVKRFAGNILFDPDQLRTLGGTPFKVFTPFWRNCLGQESPSKPLPIPKGVNFSKKRIASDKLSQWSLLPTKPNWAKQFDQHWQPAAEQGHQYLQQFLNQHVSAYRDRRNEPSVRGTSRLSPYLHFGQISPRQVWHQTQDYLQVSSRGTKGAETFLSEIGWREFSYHLLFHHPNLPRKVFRQNFAEFPWKKNIKHLRLWQQGMTGFPIVDAGMRELWATGWMHNRVRMIVASFLTKDLLIPWQQGAAWFWDTLVDADLASNSASWQWVAGCGADAAPYFRIFNPTLQSAKFDGEGEYLKRWIPELSGLPKKYIHQPEIAPKEILAQAGVELGVTYPLPMIDRKAGRQRALEAYQSIKKTS